MDLSTLYWILVLPSLGTALGVIATFASALLIISGGFIFIFKEDGLYSYEKTERESVVKRKSKTAFNLFKWSALPIFIGVTSNLIPSEKQMMYMIGGYAATNVENIEKLPKNVVNAANKFLESYTDAEKKEK